VNSLTVIAPPPQMAVSVSTSIDGEFWHLDLPQRPNGYFLRKHRKGMYCNTVVELSFHLRSGVDAEAREVTVQSRHEPVLGCCTNSRC
jgi:hypothetical protein